MSVILFILYPFCINYYIIINNRIPFIELNLWIFRLLGSRSPCLLNAGYNLNRNALFTTSAQKCIQMKIVQPDQLDKLSYDEKNALLKREQSPHLSIYKPQLTSMLSITHRITGKNIQFFKFQLNTCLKY